MKILRFRDPLTKAARAGTLENGRVLSEGTDFGLVSELEVLAPCEPSKVIAAAINYHGATDWEEGMTEPLFFLKAPSSVCAPSVAIVSPFSDVSCWGEAELAIVIGKTAKNVSVSAARDSILGFTVANDVSCDNLGKRDHHLLRSKAADTFCPLGPYIDTQYDPSNKMIRSFHNGRLVRQGNTKDFFWDPLKVVSQLSHWMTLNPGDLILTGSPPMIGDIAYFSKGDEFVAEVEGFPPLISHFRGIECDL